MKNKFFIYMYVNKWMLLMSIYYRDNKYGRMALDVLLKSVIGTTTPLISPPADYKPGDFFNGSFLKSSFATFFLWI